MADYFIRVELHEADKSFAYEELHKKMEAHGYHRQIRLPQNPMPRGAGLRDVIHTQKLATATCRKSDFYGIYSGVRSSLL